MAKAVTKPEAAKAKKSTPEEEFRVKPEDYNAVIMAAHLSNIVLKKSEFEIGEDYRRVPRASHKHKYGHKWESVNYDQDAGIAGGSMEWSVSVQTGRKKGLKVKAVFLIVYENLQRLNPEAVEMFIETVGRVAIYPYFRNHVSQLSWQSGAKLPILPVISTFD